MYKGCDTNEADKRDSAGNKNLKQILSPFKAETGTKQNIMAQVKSGDKVKVHYTGKLTSGEQFDSSAGREPLEFTVGGGQMIKGFDAAMPGMSVGEKKTINIPAAEAYGEKDPNAVIEFPKENVPEDMKLETGMQLNIERPEWQSFSCSGYRSKRRSGGVGCQSFFSRGRIGV